MKVVGSGTREAAVGEWTEFEVDTSQAKDAKLDVKVTGPGKPKTDIMNNGNGIYTVKYFLNLHGEYNIVVLLDGVQIQGSPFKPTVLGKSIT